MSLASQTKEPEHVTIVDGNKSSWSYSRSYSGKHNNAEMIKRWRKEHGWDTGISLYNIFLCGATIYNDRKNVLFFFSFRFSYYFFFLFTKNFTSTNYTKILNNRYIGLVVCNKVCSAILILLFLSYIYFLHMRLFFSFFSSLSFVSFV